VQALLGPPMSIDPADGLCMQIGLDGEGEVPIASDDVA